MAEHYLDWSGFIHAQTGIDPAVRSPFNENGVSRLPSLNKVGPQESQRLPQVTRSHPSVLLQQV